MNPSSTISPPPTTEPNSQFSMPEQPTATTTTTTSITAATVAPTTEPIKPHPPNPSPVTKLTSRPRKLRKLSPSTTTTTTSNPNKPPPTPTNLMVVTRPRHVARSLSSQGEIEIALRHLRESDPHLSRLIDSHQPPTFDSFQTPFLALTKSILYQQLAYKAGTSIYSRFVALCGGETGVLPDTVLGLNPQQLRQIGVSGRKSSYLHDLARKYQNGILSDSAIVNMDDKSLFTMLTMVNGIGSWSVHMFMIFSLHRPDVLPVNDLGVRKGVQLLYGLEDLPRPSQMEQLCEKWRPYRSVASWYLWRFVEAKGAPCTLAVATATTSTTGGLSSHQPEPPQMHPIASSHQQQQQQQHQPQFLDPINGIMNLGYCSPLTQ